MHRTIEEYKKDVFDKLNEDQKLQFIYTMSEQLCTITDICKDAVQYIPEYDSYDCCVDGLQILKLLGVEENEYTN